MQSCHLNCFVRSKARERDREKWNTISKSYISPAKALELRQNCDGQRGAHNKHNVQDAVCRGRGDANFVQIHVHVIDM